MAKQYETGYGKPPKEKRFMKGQSGNPKGRPKGSKNLSTLFRDIASETIEVTVNGRVKIMTRKQAIVLQLANRALSGEQRSMKEFIYLLRLAEEPIETETAAAEPGERDVVLLKNILERMTRMKQQQELDPSEPILNTEKTEAEVGDEFTDANNEEDDQ